MIYETVYQYVAYNEREQVVKGRLEATNEETATELLGYAGYRVISLKPFMPFLRLDKLLPSLFRVKTSEIILFYRELALLLESGVDIISALELLQNQVSNPILKRVWSEVISDLRGGNQLSTALGKHPKIFPTIYCRLLAVGEQSGGLETMLRQIADYMEKEDSSTKAVKNALMYPVMTLAIAVVVIGVLITFVLPAFSRLYGSLGVELPAITRMLISIGINSQKYGVFILLGLFMAAIGAYYYIKTPKGRYKLDKVLLKLPLIGRVNHFNELVRYCRSMALLFKAGLPLTEILPLVVQGSNNKVMSQALIDVQQQMVRGEGLSRPMARNDLFPAMMVRLVRVGEETGNLDTTLTTVAQSYETEVDDKTKSMIALIQPALTLVIGLVIGFIALSLSSAMYSIYGSGF